MSGIVKITRVEEIEELLEASKEREVWIFKHSLLCPTSRHMLEEFQRFAESRDDGTNAEYRLVEIQSARPVSAAVEESTGVQHQSPQCLLVERWGGGVARQPLPDPVWCVGGSGGRLARTTPQVRSRASPQHQEDQNL